MKVKFRNLKISHIAACLPKERISIMEYAKNFTEKEVKRIKKTTGVEAVHIAPDDMCSSDYHVLNAKRLMTETGLTGADFDGIVLITQTPDYRVPATSVILQDRLGLSKESVAFDINYGCSGYVYGLYQAALLISSGSCKRVLIFSGDNHLRMIHKDDRANRMVLGDGFAVTVMEQGDDDMNFIIYSDGSGYRAIFMEAGGFRMPETAETKKPVVEKNGQTRWPNCTYMDGLEIMHFALSFVPPLIDKILEYAGWTKEETDLFAMHQANRIILEFLAKRIGVDLERLPIALEDTGNTVSATIPIMLTKKHKEFEETNRLQKTIICGFGIGLSWGAATADLSETKIYDTWTF